MERVLYVVAREQPMLVGYLMTAVDARSSEGHPVEIKLDERRAERRLSRDARAPERRQGERRLRPSLDHDIRSRGYATVVQSVAGSSRMGEPTPALAMVWRPRSSWRQRAARAERRSRVWWGLILALLTGVGVVIVVARSIHWTPAPAPSAPQIAPQITPRTEKASPPPPALKAETVVPAVPPLPPSRPAPARIVSMRSSGVVLSVDPRASMLVLEDRGTAGDAGRLRVELAPDARVVLSERDDRAQDPSSPFKDTVISHADVRRGDYVVVERRGPEGKELGHSVVVTFRPH
jgi:hypothetical protein